MNRTKAGCEIDEFMADGPTECRMGVFEAAIRSAEDVVFTQTEDIMNTFDLFLFQIFDKFMLI